MSAATERATGRPACGVDRPVFLVGMPRSGTTAIFESLATHPDVGWLSHHFNRFPRLPALAALARLCDVSPFFRKAVAPPSRGRAWFERLRDGPAEAYDVWETYCGEKFRFDYLLGQRATPEERDRMTRVVRAVLRYQGKKRFVAKLTGPARMGYLMSLFPDARFVHILRDGRAVVDSLMRVDFWRDSSRTREPAWRNGLSDAYLRTWEAHDRSPLVLAALQWRAVIERAREERDALRPERYVEMRYEDFLAGPAAVMQRIWEAAELAPSRRTLAFIAERLRPAARPESFRDAFRPEQLAVLDELLGDLLDELGYARGSPPASDSYRPASARETEA